MIYISYLQTKITSSLLYLNKYLPMETKTYLIYKSLDTLNIYLKDKIIFLTEFLLKTLKESVKDFENKTKKGYVNVI